MLPSELWPNRNHRLWGSILTVCLSVWIQGAAAEVIDAGVGQTATLTAPVTADILVSAWYRGTAVTASQQICYYVFSTSLQRNGPQYTGRETCGPDGSLVIRDLLTNHTGNYTVNVTPSDALPVTATRQLRVYGWLCIWTQLTAGQGLWAEVVTAVEGQTATLPASVTTGVFSFNWYRGTATNNTLLIITYVPSSGAQTPGPQSTGRELVLANGSLRLRDLRTSDSGYYTVSATLTNGTQDVGPPRQLTVHEHVCLTPCSSWQTTLGVACGVLLGAAVIVAGMAVHYERRLNRKGTSKDENVYQNPSIIKNADAQNENVRKGREGQSANPGLAANSVYMELEHGDRATYDQLKR
ncbi:cell adhesion molecule CEACAM21-like [Lissotriton helveticus]